jgi:hypothetical protein
MARPSPCESGAAMILHINHDLAIRAPSSQASVASRPLASRFGTALDAGLADISYIYDGAYQPRAALTLAQRSAYGISDGGDTRASTSERPPVIAQAAARVCGGAVVQHTIAVACKHAAAERSRCNAMNRIEPPTNPGTCRSRFRCVRARSPQRKLQCRARLFHAKAGAVEIRCWVVNGSACCGIKRSPWTR